MQEIYEFMKLAAEQKWGKRFMRKTTIESAIKTLDLDPVLRYFLSYIYICVAIVVP